MISKEQQHLITLVIILLGKLHADKCLIKRKIKISSFKDLLSIQVQLETVIVGLS